MAPVICRWRPCFFPAQKEAAAKVHDERIGVGHVYHLFRLPEELEQAVHRVLHDQESVQRIARHVADKSAAISFQHEHSEKSPGVGLGPTRVAETAAIREQDAWRTAAGHYARAFEGGSQVYPYFADKR